MRACLCREPPQVHPVNKLHEEVVEAVGLTEIVDGDDMRMAEHGHRPSLAGKPLGKGRVLADLRREDFQRHQPVEPLLPGLVDHAHPAPAHQFQDFQVGEMRLPTRPAWAARTEPPQARCPPGWRRSDFPDPVSADSRGKCPAAHAQAARPRIEGNGFLRSWRSSHPSCLYRYYKQKEENVTARAEKMPNYRQLKR